MLHTVQLVAWVACCVSLVGVLLSGIVLVYTRRPVSDEHLISAGAFIIMAFSFGLVGALA